MLKRTLSLLLCLCMVLALVPVQGYAQEDDEEYVVEINEENFPDENFRNYLLQQSYGEDGILTKTEMRDQVFGMDVHSMGIKDLTGIEYFVNLSYLNCSNNELTALDVSALLYLDALICYNNQIAYLDVSKNSRLKNLYCDGNPLTELDFSKNPNLLWLTCDNTGITALDLSFCPKLTHLYCRKNPLVSVNLEECTKLKKIFLGNNQLNHIRIPDNLNLEACSLEPNSYTACFDENRQLDLTTLPGTFDVSRASNWQGGMVSGNVLKAGSDTITYTYQVNDSISAEFTIQIGRCADEDGDHYCDNCGKELSKCADNNKDHTCDTCGSKVSDCVDENRDGKCDICGVKMTQNTGVIRIAGKGRWDTAIKTANELKSVLGVEKFNAIILACGSDSADALAGSYLSAVKNAPILLSYGGNLKQYAYLDTNNIDYIKANLAESGTVYILGGENAVPMLYEDGLTGFNVKRLGGENRFDTNRLILAEAGVPSGSEVLVCTAYNFADSLSASATGKPILLVYTNDKGKHYGVDDAYLQSLSGCRFTILGGEAAVSVGMEKILKNYGAVERLAGERRFETSVMVAERYFDSPDSAVLAYAWNYPDGLCGGALAYATKAPLILTMDGWESAAKKYAQSGGITSGYVLGGTELISDATVEKILFPD